jgi:transcription elongation GreA/GreB family factor
MLMAQKSQLERELARSRITDFTEASTEQISVGSIVDLRNPATGETVRYSVLGLWDGDPEHQIISYKTPLGLALLGKKPGDQIKVKSGGKENDYSITGISRYVDLPPAGSS